MSAPTLRPYQRDAIEAARAVFRSGQNGALVVLPTGTGKTVVFAEVARLAVERGGRVLVLAHRKELLKQARRKLLDVGVRAELEQGPNRAGDADVVVASRDTLKGKRLATWPRDAFAVVVIDEAHHAPSKAYGAILEYFASARVLGVTATPDRADGVGLASIFGERPAYVYELRAAIADGYLVPIRARSVHLDVNLDAIKRTRGDFDQGELGAAMSEAAILDASARALLAERGHRPTIAFTVTVAHAYALAEAINAHRPGLAVAIDGTADDETRERVELRLRNGDVGIVCNAALWTEGFDCPPVACVAIYRPTGSRTLFAQMIGRGTRLHEQSGKRDLLVLDFAGTTNRHRLVTPADVLEGDLPDEIAELVTEELRAEGGGDVEAAIERAKAHLARVRNAPIARWLTTEIGDLLGEHVDMRLCGDGFGLARPEQLAQLEGLGFYKIPPTLTDLAAARIIAILDNRARRGLCSYKQAGMLKRRGVRAEQIRTMTKRQASDALTARGVELRARTQTERVTADKVPLRRPE